MFLIVMLVLTDVVIGLFALIVLFVLAVDLGLFGLTPAGGADQATVVLIAVVVLFALTITATVGVARRYSWARVLAIIVGIAVSLTCLGLVLGIPIIVAAYRVPLKKAV
jgi:hypothetical protein